MRRTMLVAAIFLGGCNTPPLGFAGIDPVRVEVEQSVFDVRVKDGRAHALRVNSEFAPNLAAVAPRARVAIELASGCQIVDGSLMGDPIFVTADLRC
ncbi:hypothetical protein [Yoonia sp.]|jgi:hypothetical protein|uniref:hypothetical protein n=1 Tax=Yoonia sp. TaxID=2212373 RepID=UPI0025DEE774|nr:hypothetical protein [Yoonia sp.]